MAEEIIIESAVVLTPGLDEHALVSSTEQARKRRDELLTISQSITTITDDIDSADAVETMKKLKAFKDRIEVLRQSVMAPILRVTREINDEAKVLAGTVLREYDRLGSVLGAYESAQKRKRDEATRKANEEAVRVANEATERANAVRREQFSPTAPVSAIETAIKAEAIEEKATERVIQIQQQAANVAPKASGSILRETPDFEVTDINSLVSHNATYCKIEANRTVILSVIKQNPNIQIPGIRHWMKAKAGVS